MGKRGWQEDKKCTTRSFLCGICAMGRSIIQYDYQRFLCCAMSASTAQHSSTCIIIHFIISAGRRIVGGGGGDGVPGDHYYKVCVCAVSHGDVLCLCTLSSMRKSASCSPVMDVFHGKTLSVCVCACVCDVLFVARPHHHARRLFAAEHTAPPKPTQPPPFPIHTVSSVHACK